MARVSGFRTADARVAYCALYDEAVAQSPLPVEERDLEGRHGVTHVLVAGDAAHPPLVAFHGKSISSTMWLPLLPTLAASRRVYLVDAVGDLNRSVARTVLSSNQRIVSWIDETLDGLRVDRPAMVGASLGSWTATHYAMARPERVERLALVGPAGLVSRQHPRWLLSAYLTAAIRPTPQGLTAFVDSMAMPATAPRLREDPWRVVVQQFVDGTPTFRTRFNEPRPTPARLDALAQSDIPVLVIVGKEESLHDGALMALRFSEQLPRARVELVEGANHLIAIDQTTLVCDLLGAFLQGPN